MRPGRRVGAVILAAALLGALLLLFVDRGSRARSGSRAVALEGQDRREPVAARDPQPAPSQPAQAVEPPPVAPPAEPEEDPTPVPMGTLELWVVSPDGPGVPGVRASLVRRDSRGAPTGTPQARTTDEEGRASFSGLADGAYRLTLSHPGYAPCVRIVGIRGVTGTLLVLTLDEGARLDVMVTGPRGEPVADQEVVVTQYEEAPRRARTGIEGVASFEHLKTSHGCYVEVVGAPGGARLEVTLPKGGRRTVEFRLGSQLIGQVLGPDGRPLAGVRVTASRDGQYHGTDTDATGHYGIDGLVPGPASLTVSSDGVGGFRTPALPVVVLEGTTEHDVHLGRREISGVVTNAGTGAPLAHVRVYLARIAPEMGVDLWLYTGSDGRFSARALPPGRYRLCCTLRDFREQEVFVDLAEETARDDLEISLDPERYGTLLLRVTTTDGRYPRDVSIGISSAARKLTIGWTNLRPRSDGLYELRLGVGEHKVYVNGAGALKVLEVRIDEGRTVERTVELR